MGTRRYLGEADVAGGTSVLEVEEPEERRAVRPVSMVRGTARRSRRAQRRRARRRTLLTGAGALAVVAALGGLLAVGWSQIRSATASSLDDAATSPTSAPAALALRAPVAVERSSLVVQTTAEGEVVAGTVLVATSGGGGTILFVPGGTLVEVPSIGLDTLRAAGAAGGGDLVRSSLENLLGVLVDDVVVLDPSRLADVLSDVEPLPVVLPEAVERVDAEGRVERLYEAGTRRLAAEEVAPLLEVLGRGRELDRFPRHQAVWEAWLAAVGGRGGAGPLAEVLERLAAGEVGYSVLPVEAVGAGEEGDGELYGVDDEALGPLVARVFGSTAGEGERFRVEVLNGTGEPGLTQGVPAVLVPIGAEVKRTGNADDFGYAETQIAYYGEEDLPSAMAVRRALGVGEVVRSGSGLDVFDVTVVVGGDFPGLTGEGDGADGAPPTTGA